MKINEMMILANKEIGELKKFSNLPINQFRFYNCPNHLLYCLSICLHKKVDYKTFILKGLF